MARLQDALNCQKSPKTSVYWSAVFIDMHMVVAATNYRTRPIGSRNVEEATWSSLRPVRCTITLEPREYASAEITFPWHHR